MAGLGGDLITSSLRVFLPGGKDFAQSVAFYEALGFTKTFHESDIAGFATEGGAFLLQNYYNEDWAGNFMMHLSVNDLDAWWAHIQSLDLPARFGIPKPKAPALQAWGLTVAYLVGPCGELWHVAQARA